MDNLFVVLVPPKHFAQGLPPAVGPFHSLTAARGAARYLQMLTGNVTQFVVAPLRSQEEVIGDLLAKRPPKRLSRALVAQVAHLQELRRG